MSNKKKTDICDDSLLSRKLFEACLEHSSYRNYLHRLEILRKTENDLIAKKEEIERYLESTRESMRTCSEGCLREIILSDMSNMDKFLEEYNKSGMNSETVRQVVNRILGLITDPVKDSIFMDFACLEVRDPRYNTDFTNPFHGISIICGIPGKPRTNVNVFVPYYNHEDMAAIVEKYYTNKDDNYSYYGMTPYQKFETAEKNIQITWYEREKSTIHLIASSLDPTVLRTKLSELLHRLKDEEEKNGNGEGK